MCKQNRPLVASTDDCAIQHFYDKLLLLRDMLKTREGKRLGVSRHSFMLDFLKQMDRELIDAGFSKTDG
jgi:uncharacterized protein